uniref:Uncharacterized protein n=1 Tax=Bracon brevicornis TaxID=1563983 RepID=A0A6V7JSL6_9HYME
MNSIVLATAAGLLILSSLISLIYLLKRNFKKCLTSPLHVLATSDIFTSFLTAALLIIHPLTQSPNDYTNFLEKTNDTNFNCDFKTILMNLAVFLVPFTNSFMSLLSMSLQCNRDVGKLHNKCNNILNCDSDLKNIENSRKSMKFYLKKLRGSKMITIFGIFSQWLIPAVVTGILLLAPPEITKKSEIDEFSCFFTKKFPFENCFENSSEKLNSSGYFYNDNKNNYIDNMEMEKLETNSSAEVDQVVEKIYGIMNGMMNSTQEIQRPEGFWNGPQLMNITSFLRLPSIDKNSSDHKNEYKSEYTNENESENKNKNEYGDEKAGEEKLFENLMKNASAHFVLGTPPEIKAPEVLGAPKLPEIIKTAEFSVKRRKNSTSLNDVQIYNQILQKIHGTKNNKVRDKLRRPPLKGRAENQYTLTFEEISNEFGHNSSCLENRCLISGNFLKIHTFLLLIFIYFLPIFLSTLLNMRSRYICVSSIEKLEISRRRSGAQVSDESRPNKPSTFGWFDSEKSEEGEGGSSEEQPPVEKLADKSDDAFKNMGEETEEMKKLVDNFRTSLITGISLWTPIFLEILGKIFLCADPPMWLMNFFYLVGVSFGAVRNYFNLKMLKSSEIIKEIFMKKNIVHPGEGKN